MSFVQEETAYCTSFFMAASLTSSALQQSLNGDILEWIDIQPIVERMTSDISDISTPPELYYEKLSDQLH